MPIEVHFTRIELTELSNHAPTNNQMDKIRRHLSSIYRKFLRSGEVEIKVNNVKLEAPCFDILNAPYYKTPKGNNILWKKEINFEAGEYKARGFIAILDKIQNSANGLVLMRRGRVIVGGGDERYFPQVLFGSPGNFRYKRLFGELELEGFEVTFNKNGFRDEEDLYVVDVKAGTYSGKLMVVKDPSRLFVGTVPEFKLEKGWTVAEIAQRYDALAGINGGEFVDSTPQTAMPIGLVMVDGNILKGDSSTMYHVTGITFDNKLVMGNMTSSKAVELGIRDCVNVSSDIGPFLIINGEPQDVDGVGGGLNPRTAIGQRADGAILLLVVDGRQATSLGASFSDLQDIMLQYGAVNASAMDGGTSTQMYYNGEVINKPYSPTGPRTLPTAFLIK